MNSGNNGHGYSLKLHHLMRLHSREGSDEISQGRSVLVTGRHRFIQPDTSHGLFVHQTQMLSRYQIQGRIRSKLVGDQARHICFCRFNPKCWPAAQIATASWDYPKCATFQTLTTHLFSLPFNLVPTRH